ncbi:hypothetical protein GCM10009679_37150 [Saccharothrix algeriensis]
MGFWTGVIASVAANVAHAFLAGSPSWLMLMFAALPPFALLVGIEVIAQVQWRKVWYQAVIRWGAVGSVAAIGGVVSYDHMRAALHAHGETGVGSVLLPVLVDGLMTVCSAALLTIGDNQRRAERAAEVPTPEVLVQGPAELPGSATPEVADAPRKVRIPARPAAGRRPEVTRELASALMSAEPDLNREQLAARLGISSRRLRDLIGPAKTSELASA